MTSFEVQFPLPARRAAEALRDQLVAYLLRERPRVGARFLSDHELVRLSKLSRPTVRRALEELCRDGWIERRHGLGTYIGPRLSLETAPHRLESVPGRARTGRMAVLVHFPGAFHFDWQSTGILDGMDEVAAANGISIELLGSRHGDPDAISRRLIQSRPDVLVCVSPRPHHVFIIAEARRTGIPVILTGSRLLSLGLPTVREDGAQGARMAVEHLAKRGHRRIGLVVPSVPAQWAFERREGYVQGLGSCGIECDENLVLWTGPEDGAEQRTRMEQFIQARRPSALLVASGTLTQQIAGLVETRRIRVPQELSLVSFDQMWDLSPWAGVLKPTVVALPLREIGRKLAEMGRGILDGQAPVSPPLIACTLAEGNTVAAAGVRPAGEAGGRRVSAVV